MSLTRHARSVAERLLARQRQTRPPSCCSRTGRDRARRLPDIVQIESTNLCNAKCVFCPRDEMHRRQGVMDMDLFKKVVDECAALGITHVRVHNYGEPFLDRQLVEKVRYAKQKGITEVGMISNGSLITEEIARGMIDAGLDAINISVDAAGKEVFERTRAPPRVRHGHRQHPDAGAPPQRGGPHASEADPVVRPAEQLGRRAGVHREWSQVADKIHITDLHNWAGTLNAKSDVQFPCYRLWLTFTVLWDGRVSLCCADFDGRHILGDLRTSTIARGLEFARSIAPCAASTSRAAAPKSADPAICRRKTRRSG